MVRKNPEEYSSVSLSKKTIKKLEKYKVHPNQSFEEVIKNFIDSVKSEPVKKEASKKETSESP